MAPLPGTVWPGKVWIDGRVIDAQDARVSVFDRGFLYGDSVYEVMRTYDRNPYALGEHLDRLAGSAARLRMQLPPRIALVRATLDTVHALSEEAYVRIIVTRGAGKIGLLPSLADDPRLIVIALPLELPRAELYRDGAAVVIVGARRNAPGSPDPQAKSGNYLSSVLAVAEASARGGYEALMCDGEGHIAEGSSSNVFVVHHNRVITPALASGLLEGITRRHLISLARSLGHPVDETALSIDTITSADEVFLTSSIRGVMPVASVDGRRIAPVCPGPVTMQLRTSYEREAAARAAGAVAAEQAHMDGVP